MEAAAARFVQLMVKCEEGKVELKELSSVKKFLRENFIFSLKALLWLIILLCVIFFSYLMAYVNQGGCAIEMPSEVSKVFRSPESCDFCTDVREVTRVTDISPEEFEEKFAYTGVPVIVTDATKNWTAIDVFDFWYFKGVYNNAKSKMKSLSCQFFPYESGFGSFFEALEIPEERVNYEPESKPWYFGWSNCNSEVAALLRQHYTRPYFLPRTSENNPVDWIFMGGPGLGAHLHVDNVRLPSWQAQLRGKKEWILAPPPECYFQCRFLRAVVQKGEILVLDTNKWYHSTNVISGDLSVTIGAEYD